MARTYILDRDRPKPVPPKEKACRECGISKPNDFSNYPKKLQGSRTEFTTADVCLVCRNAKISAGMRKAWVDKKSWSGPPLDPAPGNMSATTDDDEDPLIKALNAARKVDGS